ncbi:hypothetical protein niasHS_007569 [Heterodera schachtii]|uniref:MYND-type domain-containing protein n=1 Tax=Heterodera schachtii TaxID=97005 RepID=A0ABD2JP05_HETSC
MAFLLQVYCPDEPSHAFHRTIFIFVCRKGNCSKINAAPNFAAFRCQLSRENAFFSAESALCPSVVGEVSDPFFDPSLFARLCVVCGCRAASRCARCARRWYCGREHQIIDWNTAHKGKCEQKSTENGATAKDGDEGDDFAFQSMKSAEKAELRQRHGFTLKEFGIELEAEEEEKSGDGEENEGDEESEESESEEEGEAEENRRKMAEFEKMAEANGVSARDVDGLEESRRDGAFARFSAALALRPEQILRYRRAGVPLLATDHSPGPPSVVPACERCGEPRQFEMQLMPNLVALMELDSVGQSVDWATLLVYTCGDSCPGEEYAREFVFKQDFVIPAETEENEAKTKERRK